MVNPSGRPVRHGSRFALAAMAVAATVAQAGVALAAERTVAPSTAFALTHAAPARTDALTATGVSDSYGVNPDGYHPPY